MHWKNFCLETHCYGNWMTLQSSIVKIISIIKFFYKPVTSLILVFVTSLDVVGTSTVTIISF